MKKIIYFIGFLLLHNICFAQQSTIDSLSVLIVQSEVDSTKVQIMLDLSKLYFVSDPNKAISISEQAKALSESINYKSGVAYSNKNIGNGYYYLSDYVQALLFWQKAKAIFEEINDVVGVSNMLSNMGAVYLEQGASVKALELTLISLKLAEEVKDTLRIATALQNISNMHEGNQDYELALNASTRALQLFETIDDVDGIGMTLLGIGAIYREKGNYDTALIYLNKSLEYLKASAYYPDALLGLGEVHLKKSDYKKALEYLNLSYNAALETGSNKLMAMSLNALAFAHEENGDLELAIELYEKSIPSALELSNSNAELLDAYSGLVRLNLILSNSIKVLEYQNLVQNVKDSIYNIESAKAQNRLLFNYEIEKKEGEIALLNKENELQKAQEEKQKLIRNGFVYAFLLVLVFASVVLIQRNKIKKGKKLSDKLLHNILPDEVAEELKEKGESVAKDFEDVSVLFSDFKGFTNISENLTPQELVAELNTCFKAFDSIISSYGMEKIKTIGDAYMAAGGLHIPRTSTTKDVVMAGLEMQDFVKQRKNELQSQDKPFFEMRLGIHTGPVVAGIVGAKKFQYDIWGDTVNIASRMESSGEVGKVNISEDTFELVKNEKLIFELRGKIEAKNKGELIMYFVKKASEK
jgi:class 3 adenylate cyclase